MCKRLICLISVLLILLPALADAASPGPVGWWKLDETTGTVAADSVAGNDGVLTGEPVWIAGQIDGALEFDGTDDFVTLPIGSLISTLGDTTITTWANFSNAGGAWQRIFDFGSGSGASPYMFLTPRIGTAGAMRFAIRTATVGEQIMDASATLPSGWHHVAVVMDGTSESMTLYQDGAIVAGGPTILLPRDMGETTQNWLGKSQWPDALYMGSLDDFRIYDRALSQDEVMNAMQGGLGYGLASGPSPANGATEVLPDVVLSWTPGQEADTHDVYFGTATDDLVLVGPGQADTMYDAGQLTFDTTYYWRVDEIGADGTVYAGNVWSFRIEPYSYAVENITATASSLNDDTMGPEKTIDGSGLDDNDQHSTTEADMWLSSLMGPEPTWIQYDFDAVYKLDKMLVWNSNQALESVVGYGAKDVTVEYSTDGTTWEVLGEFEFAQAPGEPTCTADTMVDFAGAAVKSVKLTINSNWGDLLAQYGLSEVRFLHIPVRPTNLSPASGTSDLEPPVALSWRPGREAVTYDIYLGTDENNLPLVVSVTESSYEAAVEPDATYYWKVVAVNEDADPPAWESEVMSFGTTALPKDPGTDHLTHQYTFEDGTANDSVGEAHGTLMGDAVVVDGSLVTDGVDDWMEMDGAAIAINTYTTGLTLEMWSTQGPENQSYSLTASFGGTWDNGFGKDYLGISTTRGNEVSRAMMANTPDQDAPWADEVGVDGPELNDALVHQYILTIDDPAADGSGELAYYVDGVLQGTAPLNGTTISGLSNDFVYLGKGVYSVDAEVACKIHKFSIYNRALSLGEVRYLAATTPKDPGTANLTHQYTFEDGTANDSVGEAHGTLMGDAAVLGPLDSLVMDGVDDWMEMDGAAIAINTYTTGLTLELWSTQGPENQGFSMTASLGGTWGNGFGKDYLAISTTRGNEVSRAMIANTPDQDAPWADEVGVDGPELNDGLMHQYVLTIDDPAADGSGELAYYIDGVLQGTTPLDGRTIGGLSNDFVYLGKGVYSVDGEVACDIHKFCIYNRALSLGEVRYLAGDR